MRSRPVRREDGKESTAAFPSQRECEAQGVMFTKSGGQVQCVIVEKGKNPKFTDTGTTTGQGTLLSGGAFCRQPLCLAQHGAADSQVSVSYVGS
jgi:hypothetical protein